MQMIVGRSVLEKKERLEQLALSVLDSPLRYQDEINYLLTRLDLRKEAVVNEFVRYNIDVFTYGNEIYESIAMRMALHIHNLLLGSWHQDRQGVVCEFLSLNNAKRFIDLGFGVPSRYVWEVVLQDPRNKLVLLDKDVSAMRFASVLLTYKNLQWGRQITLSKENMNEEIYCGDYGLYLFLDSLEHLEHPERYLGKIVQSSSHDAQFIFSLPIGAGPQTHSLSWESDQQAERWLQDHGLRNIRSKTVWPNLDVDVFAKQLPGLHNYITLCEKYRCVA